MSESENTGESSTNASSDPILVPLDGTDEAEGILSYVCQVARGTNAPLILHGVVDPHAIDFPASAGPYVIYADEAEAAALSYAAEHLRIIERRLQKEDVKTQIMTTLGRPADEILRVAAEERCGLIAMSTHGRNAIGRAILGSVTDKVVRSSTLPVLTIAPNKAKEYQARHGGSIRRVMLPLDGSELAEHVIPYVEPLARALSLEVTLVRVVDQQYPIYDFPSYEQLRTLSDRRITEANGYLRGVARDLKSRRLNVQTKLLRGTPARALLDLAHNTPNDLIAITTHGRSGLSRWSTGSVADALIRASGDPVLVVRPTSDERSGRT